MSLRTGIAIVTMLVCTAPVAPAQAGWPARITERIVDLTLSDAAVAIADPIRPIIYYNPVILQRQGPAMAAFILAHEEAHIQLKHVRLVAGVVDAARLRRLELEADCSAARQLSRSQPEAIRAAVHFFGALGTQRMDEFHPSGSDRVARILGCAGTTGPGEALRPRPVRAGVGEGPDVS